MTAIHIINGETWLICGGRDFTDQAMFDDAMNRLIEMWGLPARIVHGAATGADAMADRWGRHYVIDVVRVPAEWEQHGLFAGPKRNWQMLTEYKPQRVIGFPGGKGTASMIVMAKKQRDTVWPQLTVVEIKKAEHLSDRPKLGRKSQ